MKSDSTSRVRKHRANLRRNGLKPVQIWIPDILNKGFIDACKTQSLLAKKAECDDLNAFIEKTADLRGWE